MSGPYNFNLTDGSLLLSLEPLESDGVGNQSVPRQVLNVVFQDPNILPTATDCFVVADDVTPRFVSGFAFDIIGGSPYDGSYLVHSTISPVAVLVAPGVYQTHIPVDPTTPIVIVPLPMLYSFSATPSITPGPPHNYTVPWSFSGNIAGDVAGKVSIGTPVVIQNVLYNGSPYSQELEANNVIVNTGLGSITGGSGYDANGTNSYTNVPLTGGTGSGATANITVTSGVVTGVSIVHSGGGYHIGDIFSVDVTGIATLGSTVPGSGYTNGSHTNVLLTGGSGSGATANITVSGGAVTSVGLVGSGTGYNVGDVLSSASIGPGIGFSVTVPPITGLILGGTGSLFQVPITTIDTQVLTNIYDPSLTMPTITADVLAITSLNTLVGGTLYAPGTFVNVPVSGGTGLGARANITVGGGGSVTSVTLTRPGGGYTVSDVLSAILTNNILTLGTIIPGSGYYDGTYLNIPLSGGSGIGATADITITGGTVVSVTIVNPGIGYAVSNILTVTSANIGSPGTGFSVPVATISTSGAGFSISVATISTTLSSLVVPIPLIPYGYIQYTTSATTSLELVGRGSVTFNDTITWGQALQDNAIHMLENFAFTSSPVSPLTGQLWYDTTPASITTPLNVCTNNITPTWVPLATKDYVDALTSGIVWLRPVLDPCLYDDSLTAPPTIDPTIPFHKTYIVKAPATGAWTGLEGHAVVYDGTQWIDILGGSFPPFVGRAIQAGDRFAVFAEPSPDDPLTTLAQGSFVGHNGQIATYNGATWTFDTPAEPDAFTVVALNPLPPVDELDRSPHYGHSYTFRGTWGVGTYGTNYQWIEFAGPQAAPQPQYLKYLKQNAEIVALPKGTPVYLFPTGQMKKAKADALATAKVVGLTWDTSIAASPATGTIQLEGIFTALASQWNTVITGGGSLVEGSIYYLDPATAGMLTATAPVTPGQYLVPIGVALSATDLFIKIEQPTLL